MVQATNLSDQRQRARTLAMKATCGLEPTLKVNGDFCITFGSSSPGAPIASGKLATPWALKKAKPLPNAKMKDNLKQPGLTQRHSACVKWPKLRITFYLYSWF